MSENETRNEVINSLTWKEITQALHSWRARVAYIERSCEPCIGSDVSAYEEPCESCIAIPRAYTNWQPKPSS